MTCPATTKNKSNRTMNICVFCSANSNLAPEYFERTRELGSWIGRNGHTLVFGGCNLGLMQEVAKAVHESGGMTVGVVPTIVERGGKVSDYVDVKILCDNLSDRKDLMIERSDVIVALPGGVGTLDEIFTVLAAASIGYHRKRVLLYNIGGFWDSLVAMLADLKRRGVMRAGFDDTLAVVGCLDELAACV